MDDYNLSEVYTALWEQPYIDNSSVKVLESSEFEAMFSGKHVAFITTKNADYIRNVQEMNILRKYAAEVTVFASCQKSYAARMAYLYMRILFTSFKNYDYVFVGFAPQLICPIWGWKFRNKIIIDFFISVYDTLVNDRRKLSAHSIAAVPVKWLDTKTLRMAAYAISDTKEHANYFINEFHAETDRLGVLYLEANKDIYYPQTVAKRNNLKGKYVVLYFGSILPLQGVDVILQCIHLLKKESGIFFQIIGPVDAAQRLEADNVEFISWLPEKELARHIAACDLCLAGHFNDKIDKAKRTIAGKAYIYEAMQKPMILGDNRANRELFSEDDYHSFVEMGAPDKLAALILEKWLEHTAVREA